MIKFYKARKLLLLLLISSLPSIGFAQQVRISGKVTASEDASNLPGVNVVVKGTGNGTVTDVEGRYTIDAPANSFLVFSFIGYSAEEVSVDNRTIIDVQLTQDITQLTEVVVVGYGTQQKIEVTGSLSTVKGKDIANVSVPSFDAALQGRIVGAQVTQSSGIPGSAVRIRIRGQSSVSGNSEPLYIVDGVPITSGDFSKRDGPANSINGNALTDINPNDIESIDVLKDAAAAAIYGARAANGVVLITTKRGKSGKTNFNFGYYTGTSTVTRELNYLNGAEWLALLDEAHRNSNGFPLPASYVIASNTNAQLTAGEVVQGGYNTNWRDKVLTTGSVQEANISATGGTDKTKFYIGATYRNDESFFIGNSFERFSARVNVDNNATDKLTIGSQTAVTSTINNQVPSVWGSVQSSALPVFPVEVQDTLFGVPRGVNTSNSNPLAQVQNEFITTSTRLFNNAYANYQISEALTFRSDFGVDILNSFDEIYTAPINRVINPLDYSLVASGGQPIQLPSVNAGSYEERRVNIINWNTNSTLTYKKTFGEHKIEALVGTSAQRSKQRTTGAFTNGNSGFRDPYYDRSVSGLQVFDKNLVNPYPVMGGYNADLDNIFTFFGYFARVNYVNNSKYLFGVSMRADGSSRFGPNKKYGYFPAASAGWIMTEEDFIKNISWVSFLKLRASYGVTGSSEIGNFNYTGTYGPASGYLGQSGLGAQRIPNPDLRWERNNQFDFGIDYGVLNDRITGTIGIYNKKSTDLLFANPIQSSTGFTSILENTGIEIVNRGIEFNITTINLTGDLQWTTDVNIASNQNEVLSTGGLPIEAFAAGLGESRLIEGYPVGQGFMLKSAGVDPTDGRELFFNNEGGVEKLTIENTDYRRPVGKPFPDFLGGINNTLKYKGFEFSFLFTFQYGNTVFDNEAKFQIGDIAFNNQRREVLNRWQSPENPGDGKTPGLFLSGPGSGRALNSDRFMYDASFLRLRTVTLSYNLPSEWVSKVRMNSVRVFVSGQNLLLFTKYPGWDPEFVNTANVGNTGQFFSPFGSSGQVSQFQQANITFNAAQNPFPQTRTITAGINVSF
jgi:TonB-dependent starch-binding outer membrane protein SusC